MSQARTPTLRQAAEEALNLIQDLCTHPVLCERLSAALAAPEPGDPACPVVAYVSGFDKQRLRTFLSVLCYSVPSPDHSIGLVLQSDAIAAIAAKDAEIAALKADLRLAAATFREYEALHRAKGNAESTAKAERNAALASLLEERLGPPAPIVKESKT